MEKVGRELHPLFWKERVRKKLFENYHICIRYGKIKQAEWKGGWTL